MKIIPFVYNDIDDLCANTYVLIDKSNNCIIIDPSKKYDGLVNYVKKNGLNLKAVLITHSHIDHFRGAELLINTFNVPLYIGFYDAPALKDSYLNCSQLLGETQSLDVKANTISEEYEKEDGKDRIEIHEDAINENDIVLIHDDLLAT